MSSDNPSESRLSMKMSDKIAIITMVGNKTASLNHLILNKDDRDI